MSALYVSIAEYSIIEFLDIKMNLHPQWRSSKLI